MSVHRHFDADGTLTGWTEVTTPSPWTDRARAEAEALVEMDDLTCPLCGGLREDCGDPDSPRFPQRHICYTARDQAAADALFELKNKAKPYSSRNGQVRAEKVSEQTPFHFRAGVRVWIADRDVNPDDKFL